MSDKQDNSALPSKQKNGGEYDIFDLGDEDFFSESRKYAETGGKDDTSAYAHNEETVPDVLPPYKRETVERTGEDMKSLMREKNSEIYDTINFDLKLEKDEELYKIPQMSEDIDEFFESLKFPSFTQEEKQDEQEKEIEPSSEADSDEGEKNAESEAREIIEERAEEEIFSREEKSDELSGTKHFNLNRRKKENKKSKVNYAEAENRKKFFENFRVLDRNSPEDEVILEKESEGNGRDSMMDTIKLKVGEDLFSAVEKAENKKHKKSVEKRIKAINTGKSTKQELLSSLKKEKLVLIILSAVFALSCASFVLAFAFPYFESTTNISPLPFCIVNLLLLAVTVVIERQYFYSGLLSLRYGTADIDLSLLVIFFFTALNDIISLVGYKSIPLEYYRSYGMIAVFAVLLRAVSSYLKTKTNLLGMETLLKDEKLLTVGAVSKKSESTLLAGDLAKSGKAKIIGCEERELATEDYEFSSPAVNKQSTSVLLLSAVGGLVLGFIYAFKLKEPGSFFLFFLSTMGLCIPSFYEASLSLLGYIENLRMSKLGSSAVNFELLEEIGTADGAAFKVSDIFLSKVSKFKRVPNSSISRSDSVVFAYCALKKGKSVLADCFKEYVDSLEIDVPEAEDFSYEDKLGFSCWVADRRVLVGNRQMLIEHSISAPTEFEEKQYAGKQKLLYVVVEGEITATFIYQYRVISQAKKVLKAFYKSGLVLLLASTEPSLTAQSVSQGLGLPISSVRLLDMKASEIVEKQRTNHDEKKAVGLFTKNVDGGLLDLVSRCHQYYQGIKFLYTMYLSSAVVALVIMTLSLIMGIKIFLNPFVIILYVLFFSAVGILFCEKDYLFSSKSEKVFSMPKVKKTEKKASAKKASRSANVTKTAGKKSSVKKANQNKKKKQYKK